MEDDMALKKRIFIVDDDKEFLEEFTSMLKDSGYEVASVAVSTAAVGIARKVKPDVILLDLRMGQMSGFEVATELKRYAETEHIPIIAMSGFYSMTEKSWLKNFCGFDKCLKKPFHPLDAINYIESVLRGDQNHNHNGNGKK
jgi:CheY-like chemotaxis protein